MLKNYLEFIKFVVNGTYIPNREFENDKCIIFVASINMATAITEYLQNEYQNIPVARYVEDDPYSNLHETNGIIVSTIQSAGTAEDIDGLITAINTHNMESYASNLQAKGRLRNKKGRKLIYVQTWCRDIPQHKKYLASTLRIFRGQLLSIVNIRYKFKI